MPRRSTFHDYFQAAIIAVLFALFVRTYLVQAFQIPTPSMRDSILVGDHILVNKFAYGPHSGTPEKELLPHRDIRRGDIIIFKFPQEPEKDYVKRVIGMPGEELEIVDGVVSVKRPGDEDFKGIQDTWANHFYPESTPDSLQNYEFPGAIPDGQYFVMGDNRDDSRDSRDWGTVHRDLIRGKALMVYWSVESPSLLAEDAPRPGIVKAIWSSAISAVGRTRWDRTFYVLN